MNRHLALQFGEVAIAAANDPREVPDGCTNSLQSNINLAAHTAHKRGLHSKQRPHFLQTRIH
jgi:hypothetical protein